MDKKIHKILACVDFSEYASMVMECAVELAGDSHIVIYNVINQMDVDMFETVRRDIPGNVGIEGYVKNVKREREEMIKQFIQKYFPKQKQRVSYIVDVGIPSIQILKTVDAESIDLVVMANKGKGNVARVLFGSAAEKVFRHSPVPVVSVRDQKIFKRDK